MRECLRLLAGLTSFMSKQALAHASSIGPEGILASSVILFYEPQINADRDGDCSPGTMRMAIACAAFLSRAVWRLCAEADRLEHAPDAVAEVKAEQADRDDVPERDPPDLEAGDDVA